MERLVPHTVHFHTDTHTVRLSWIGTKWNKACVHCDSLRTVNCKKSCAKWLANFFSSVWRGPQLSSSNHQISHSLPQTESSKAQKASALTLDCCWFTLTAKTISFTLCACTLFRADNGIEDNYIGPTGTSVKTAIRGYWEQYITEMDKSAITVFHLLNCSGNSVHSQ